ncbi:hypothetical protein HID58_054114 [Brassica napus]|uniref:RNase H type-1 domain-containing protein n=1 Tax=Brassica napus TaxID=3708 RepID=A0ABQ8AI30_BRANA|nr:hypothetical protein HID58_054114 [Brassica napus]
MVTKVVDLESSVSDMEDETTGGVFLGVSKRRNRTSPDFDVLNPSLPSHDAADPSSPSFRLVKIGSGPCSVFRNQLLRIFIRCSLLYIGRSKPNTSGSPTYWLRRETNYCRLRFVLSISVWFQPYHVCGSFLSLTSAFTTQHVNFAALSFAIYRLGLVSIELWTRHSNVGGWSPCLNSAIAYPSDIIKLLPQGIEVKCSRTGVQGEFIFDQDTIVEFSNQDNIHSSSSSSRSRTLTIFLAEQYDLIVEIHLVSRIIIVSITVVLAYLMDCIAKSSFSRSIAKAFIFTGQSGTSNTRGSTRQDFVSSMLVTEALMLQSGLLTAENLEIPTLKMTSNNSTLVRAINNDNQNKEIYGIVKDNQQLSSDFVDFSFFHISRRCKGDADRLAKTALGSFLVLDQFGQDFGPEAFLSFNEFVRKKKVL